MKMLAALAPMSLLTYQEARPWARSIKQTGAMPVVSGQAVTTAHFAKPGTYHLVVSATDRAMTTRLVTVTVQALAK